MRSWLASFFRELFGESIARALGGAGLTLASAALVLPLVTSLLNLAASKFGGIPSDILNISLLFGLGEMLSGLGAAMLTRTMMQSTNLGIKKATKT